MGTRGDGVRGGFGKMQRALSGGVVGCRAVWADEWDVGRREEWNVGESLKLEGMGAGRGGFRDEQSVLCRFSPLREKSSKRVSREKMLAL